MGKNTRDLIGGALAILIVLALIGGGVALLFQTVPTDNKDLFNVWLMAVVSISGIVYNWRFGTSKSSADKDATISKLAAAPPEPPPGAPAPPTT